MEGQAVMAYGYRTQRTGGRPYRQGAPASNASTGQRPLVSARQSAALDRMAAAHGFASGSALLCDIAQCDAATLGRKPRSVVQMFIDEAFTRYGRSARGQYGYTSTGRARCEDAPCCGCCD